MEINKLCIVAHENAVNHGFWDSWEKINKIPDFNGEYDAIEQDHTSKLLMLIVGEVSEAMEALRKNDDDNFKEELADVVIRVFDLCGGLNIDLETEITKKMEKNVNRPYKHGKAF